MHPTPLGESAGSRRQVPESRRTRGRRATQSLGRWRRIAIRRTEEMLSGKERGGQPGAVALAAVLSLFGAKQGAGI